MNAPQVTLQSITGVDVQLQIAGAGSRSYAFVIDWHIRIVVCLAWFFGGTLIVAGNLAIPATDSSSTYALFVMLPSMAIYFLYHPVLEIAMHGRTPGKRIAGVRLVTRSGDIPSAGALLVRNIFRLIDSLPAAYLVGLTAVIFTAQHVRIGDLAAGTLLVFDNTDQETSFGALDAADRHGLSPQAADLIQELLDRWTALDKTRADIARALIARVDPMVSTDALRNETDEMLRERLRSLSTTRST